jgi:hypothetical protein
VPPLPPHHLYPPPHCPSSSGAPPAISLIVPPVTHPLSSCSWGWRWVVCHPLPWAGGSGVGTDIGIPALSSVLASLSLSLSWCCWGGGGKFQGGGVSSDVACRWVGGFTLLDLQLSSPHFLPTVSVPVKESRKMDTRIRIVLKLHT